MDDDIIARNIATTTYVYNSQKLDYALEMKTKLREVLGSDDPLVRECNDCYDRCSTMLRAVRGCIIKDGGNGYKRICAAADLNNRALDTFADLVHQYGDELDSGNISVDTYSEMKVIMPQITRMSIEFSKLLCMLYN